MQDELSWVLLFLYIDTVILYVLYFYLEAVLPKEYGTRKHPLFFLQPLFNLIKGLPTKKATYFPRQSAFGKESDSISLLEVSIPVFVFTTTSTLRKMMMCVKSAKE